jgi:hypothetical protein
MANALDGYCEGRLVKSEDAFIRRQRELIRAMQQYAGHPQYRLIREFYESYTDGYWVAHGLYKDGQ